MLSQQQQHSQTNILIILVETRDLFSGFFVSINKCMAFTVRCDTLFDITQTGVISRRNANTNDPNWILKRNQQCNLDTIIQAISLRSQPENITYPIKNMLIFNNKHNFGNAFVGNEQIPYWSFEFEINYTNVFHDGHTELGLLYNDCNNVPMIKCGTEWADLIGYLNTTADNRNIYFEVTKNA